jgi:adenylate kinase family enzyme
MQRLIVTGPNGAGKSYVAAQLGAARPDIPIISFDTVKLTRGWKQRPKSEIDAELLRIIEMDTWILEGGPSLLHHAMPRAHGVMWLDPPEWIRAWRLLVRPWRSIGRTRPELPPGNNDWPWEQYRFAIRSLNRRSKFRDDIANFLRQPNTLRIWHIRSKSEVDAAVEDWRNAKG